MTNELVKVSYEDDKATVLGRDLHKALEVNSNYTTWFNRMTEYGFVEGEDYVVCFPKKESGSAEPSMQGGQNKMDHQLTLDMAKEIAMIQRTPIGKKVRQYFIYTHSIMSIPTPRNSRVGIFSSLIPIIRHLTSSTPSPVSYGKSLGLGT